MRLFLDSCVLLDWWFKREGKQGEPWHAQAEELLENSIGVNELFSSYSFIMQALSKTLNENRSLELYDDFLNDLKHKYRIFFITVSPSIISCAKKLCARFGLDLEDAVQLECAILNNCDYIISRDRHFLEASLPVSALSAQAFSQQFCSPGHI